MIIQSNGINMHCANDEMPAHEREHIHQLSHRFACCFDLAILATLIRVLAPTQYAHMLSGISLTLVCLCRRRTGIVHVFLTFDALTIGYNQNKCAQFRRRSFAWRYCMAHFNVQFKMEM